MTIRDSLKSDLDLLPDEILYTIRDFILFQKYRLYEPNAETLEALLEVEQMKENPSFGKSYTDVDLMVEELLS